MDKSTLEKLLKEATLRFKIAKAQFKSYDNTDDMHEMEHWQQTVYWLTNKIEDINRRVNWNK